MLPSIVWHRSGAMSLIKVLQDKPSRLTVASSVSCHRVGVGGSVVSEVTIYHNPNCGTSRNVLGLIKRMEIRVRELLRRQGAPYDELGLDDPKWTDDQLIDATLANPILINR